MKHVYFYTQVYSFGVCVCVCVFVGAVKIENYVQKLLKAKENEWIRLKRQVLTAANTFVVYMIRSMLF